MTRFEPSHPEFSDNGDNGHSEKERAALREQWLGYLLGALEPGETAQVERALQANPELKSELAAIERSLRVLGYPEREDDIAHDDAPLGLANRTLDFVDAHADVMRRIDMDFDVADHSEEDETELATARREFDAPPEVELPKKRTSLTRWFSSSQRESAGDGRSYTWVDMAVVASLITTAVVLILPVLNASRNFSQSLACQNNLRELGLALHQFAEFSPDHAVPRVAPSGPRGSAGIYAVALKDRQLLKRDKFVICPTSPQAAFTTSFAIPSFDELDLAAPDKLPGLQRTMGGSYGYNLGYMVEGRGLHAPKMEYRSQYPLMSDAPRTGELRSNVVTVSSPSHGRCGDNILFEDGGVRSVRGSDQLPWPDNPFLNRSGLIAAGEDAEDVVIAESPARAIPAIFKSLPEGK
jgi:hypothetical protein